KTMNKITLPLLREKFLDLTFNNGALARELRQDTSSLANVSQLADEGYHQPVIGAMDAIKSAAFEPKMAAWGAGGGAMIDGGADRAAGGVTGGGAIADGGAGGAAGGGAGGGGTGDSGGGPNMPGTYAVGGPVTDANGEPLVGGKVVLNQVTVAGAKP